MFPKVFQKRGNEGTLFNPFYEGLTVMTEMDINTK